MAQFGFYLLFLSCLLSFYVVMSSLLAAYWRHRPLFNSARLALSMVFVLAFLASALMVIAFYEREFSLVYVFKNSSLDLTPFYTFTAFWSSLEGSHMLWTLLLSLFSVVASWTYVKDNEHIIPYVMASLSAVLCWMFYLAITHADLFALLPYGRPPNGQGMNALLQNPYMAIHPPLLFTGYTTIAIPFAYSIAALCYGDITQGWLKTTRRWALVSWSFLTVGIILGGRWAYVELGWAGYWAWDPVENSSLLPWLLITAFLHSLLIQGQVGQLKRFSFTLAMLAFFLSFFGTFITRSGVITSVHSFAESPIGPAYLIFLAAIVVVCSVLFAVRAPLILPTESEKVWGVSKESALVVTLLIILSFAAIVFVGTIFPIVSEAITQQRISIQAPYFNTFAPFIGLALIVAIALGNLLRYHSGAVPYFKQIVGVSFLAALIPAGLLCYFSDVLITTSKLRLVIQALGIYLCCWAICCLCGELYVRYKPFHGRFKFFVQRNLAYLGATIAHIGVLIMIIGFLGNLRGLHQDIGLKAGERKKIFDYEFQFSPKGLTVRKDENRTLFEAEINVYRNHVLITKLYPARSKYPTSKDLLTEVAVASSWWRDIYLVLRDFDMKTGEQVTLSVSINYTVRFVWLATVIMVCGGLIAALDPYRGDRTRDVLIDSYGARN